MSCSPRGASRYPVPAEARLSEAAATNTAEPAAAEAATAEAATAEAATAESPKPPPPPMPPPAPKPEFPTLDEPPVPRRRVAQAAATGEANSPEPACRRYRRQLLTRLASTPTISMALAYLR